MSFIAIIVILVLALFFVYASIRILREYERGVVCLQPNDPAVAAFRLRLGRKFGPLPVNFANTSQFRSCKRFQWLPNRFPGGNAGKLTG
jgi:hypothetical protein